MLRIKPSAFRYELQFLPMRKRKQPAADIQHLYFDEQQQYALIYVKHELNIYVRATCSICV